MSEQSQIDKIREYEAQAKEKRQQFFKKLVSKIPLFVGILIALWWIFYGMVDVEFKFSLLFENVILTIATIVFAITYCNLIAEGGFKQAEETSEYNDAKKEHELAAKDGYKYQKEIINYAKEIALTNLREVRKNNLESNLLKYEEYFGEDDSLIKKDFWRDKTLTKSQKKVIRKCARMHIVLPDLFGGVSETFFGLKKEKSKKEYISTQQASKIVMRTILSFVSALVFFHYKGLNVDGLIYALFQIVLWTASGVSQRISNYNFVIGSLLPQLKTKTLIINGYLDNHKEEPIQKDVFDHMPTQPRGIFGGDIIELHKAEQPIPCEETKTINIQ